MVVPAGIPSTGDGKAGESDPKGHPWLHEVLDASLGYVRPYLKTRKHARVCAHIHTHTHTNTHTHARTHSRVCLLAHFWHHSFHQNRFSWTLVRNPRLLDGQPNLRDVFYPLFSCCGCLSLCLPLHYLGISVSSATRVLPCLLSQLS